MHWANFLHLYQPADQQPDILEAVVAQSYRPLLEAINKHPGAKLTLNVSGSLLELFDKYGYHDLLDLLKKAALDQKIEFTSSAKYHPILPFLDEDEIEEQIRANDETSRRYLGEAYRPQGFFPPEMAYAPKLLPVLEKMGFKWIILDEISCSGKIDSIDYTKLYKIKNTKLLAFFKERRLSNAIMSAAVRNVDSLREAMKKDLLSSRYIITGMDGETFGHHRPGLEKMLFEVFALPEFNLARISDLTNFYSETIEVTPIESTWASSVADIQNHIQFLSWSDPENIIHKYQHEFVKLALDGVHDLNKKDEKYPALRHKMDIALASDHFWWASAKPWWSLEMIELGAFRLYDIVNSTPKVSEKKLAEAKSLYEKIISIAFDWQRTGKIRKMMQEQKSILRIPFQDRTVGKGGAEEGVYHAFINMMRDLELKSAENAEYEKAILWRDAIFKLENKLDIFETVNVIDLLRVDIDNEIVEKTIEQYKEKYRLIRGGQPEQRGS